MFAYVADELGVESARRVAVRVVERELFDYDADLSHESEPGPLAAVQSHSGADSRPAAPRGPDLAVTAQVQEAAEDRA